jgi:hypothetical protein
VLTYYYSTGLYASLDIEAAMRRDDRFRQLCDGEYPNWKSIRRFRRLNHEIILDCLARALLRAGDLRVACQTDAVSLRDPARSSQTSVDPLELNCFVAEAENRIAQAMFLDSMADED